MQNQWAWADPFALADALASTSTDAMISLIWFKYASPLAFADAFADPDTALALAAKTNTFAFA